MKKLVRPLLITLFSGAFLVGVAVLAGRPIPLHHACAGFGIERICD